MSQKFIKKIAWGVLIALVCLSLGFATFIVLNLAEYYPDETLTIGEKITGFFERVTLPIKIARLSFQPVDAQVLMPVYGARISQIADTWGAPRGEDRLHEGQDIFASKGTPIFSGTDGYVTRITSETLGGNSISIVGAGGRRYYYTHLDRFADQLRVGQAVTTDTVIGFVGNTGNAETTPPHLHFGIYEFRRAIDPLPFLKDRPRP